jgi:hypothetical protein
VSDNDSATVTVIGPAMELTVVANPQTIYPGEIVNLNVALLQHTYRVHVYPPAGGNLDGAQELGRVGVA